MQIAVEAAGAATVKQPIGWAVKGAGRPAAGELGKRQLNSSTEWLEEAQWGGTAQVQRRES